MPFKSEAQRRYMHANLPKIAQRWEQEYSNGGIASQGGMKNYLGKQPMVNAPKYWQSSPDHPTTELAYITPAEKDLLIRQDLHGSLNGSVNQGPSGIMSLNGWGSYDSPDSNVDTGMSGVATSAAESGGGSGADRKELDSYIDYGSNTQLPPGVTKQLPSDIQDYRNAFIAAGGGQRVNPGFFDSRNTVSPAELSAAKAYNPTAFKKARSSGIMDFIGGGGFLGNIVRGVGQKFGLGKRFDKPTYDMRGVTSVNPNFMNDLGNEYLEKLAEEDTLIDSYTTGSIPFHPGMTVGYGTGIENADPNVTQSYTYTSDLAPEFQDMVIQTGGTVGNYSQNSVANQLYGKDYRVLDPFTQQQIDKLIDDVGTKSTGELASGTSSDYT